MRAGELAYIRRANGDGARVFSFSFRARVGRLPSQSGRAVSQITGGPPNQPEVCRAA